ncbi:response regulator [Jannaschia formosa]|nr:response regulator [Jannaschia formosa]
MIADELRLELEDRGAEVLGPVPSVRAALELLSSEARVDGATLDVTLGREESFPVADVLLARNIPFVFTTGYDDWAIPEPYRSCPRCSKPADIEEIIRALFG